MYRRITHVYKQGCNVNKCCFRFLTGPTSNEATVRDPLAGVRILDLSRIVAGPFCTMILGDLGAEIIKVENPNGGDETRSFGPPFVQDESAYFLSCNKNKQSIVIDLKKQQGKDLLKELAKKSDVLVENFVPGKMSKFGLDYESLKAIAPHLIYCSISGFGSSGPYRDRSGVDIIAASIGGLLHITGPENGEPCSVGVPLTDIVTGMYAHGAIMAALLQRSKTGKGQSIECDLLGSQVTILANIASNYLNAGYEAERFGSKSDAIAPYQAYKTKDGYISVSCVGNKPFQNLCKQLNLSHLPEDPMFSTVESRLINREKLVPHFEKTFLSNTNEYWLKVLEGCQVPYGPVNRIGEVFKDPQVVHKKIVCGIEHSKLGNIKVLGPAVTYSYASNEVRLPPPCFGEHTDSILEKVLSYSSEKIKDLREAEVVY